MKNSFYFVICLVALPLLLAECDNYQLPPYTGVMVNGPEPPAPPTAEDTAAFMEIASLEGTWQLVSKDTVQAFVTNGMYARESIDYRDSAIFCTFTVDEYSLPGRLYDMYGLRQKGRLTVRRGGDVEVSFPYDYYYVDFFNPLAMYIEAITNLAVGDTAFWCGRSEESHMLIQETVRKPDPEIGSRSLFTGRSCRFEKVE